MSQISFAKVVPSPKMLQSIYCANWVSCVFLLPSGNSGNSPESLERFVFLQSLAPDDLLHQSALSCLAAAGLKFMRDHDMVHCIP